MEAALTAALHRSPRTLAPVRASVREGVAAMLPFVVGDAPCAVAIGAAVSAHGETLAGWSGSWLRYGGSAHLATLRTLDSSGLVLAIVTGTLINTRLVVYSASLARRWKGKPRWFRLLVTPLVIDPTWALAEGRDERAESPQAQRRFFVAAGLALGAGWSALMAVGVVVGDRLDSSLAPSATPAPQR